MEQQNLGLQAPWITILGKLQAMFAEDGEVEVKCPDMEANPFVINIDTINATKCEALKRVLKTHYELGNVTVDIVVRVIDDGVQEDPTIEDFIEAFSGNPVFVTTASVTNPMGQTFDHVIFAKEVIQFYNDDISDIYGNFNGTVEQVACDILNRGDINFSTSNGSEESADDEEEAEEVDE
jgi:hypothetical protein